jgi:hypothetical protein
MVALYIPSTGVLIYIKKLLELIFIDTVTIMLNGISIRLSKCFEETVSAHSLPPDIAISRLIQLGQLTDCLTHLN